MIATSLSEMSSPFVASLSFETLLSFEILFDVATLTLTPPDDLPAVTLMLMPIINMRMIAPPAHSRGVVRCDSWLMDGSDGIDGKMLLLVSTVTLCLMNSVLLVSVAASSQCCSRIVIRWWGKWIFLVSTDCNDTAEQLNFMEVSLQVIGSSSLVWNETVQFVDVQLSSLGQDSETVMFPEIRRVNVWNSGLEDGLDVAFIVWCAQHVHRHIECFHEEPVVTPGGVSC